VSTHIELAIFSWLLLEPQPDKTGRDEQTDNVAYWGYCVQCPFRKS